MCNESTNATIVSLSGVGVLTHTLDVYLKGIGEFLNCEAIIHSVRIIPDAPGQVGLLPFGP